MADLEALLKRLVEHRVEFVIVGGYAAVLRKSVSVDLGFGPCHILNLNALIKAKEAMDRPRDRQALLQLRAIKQRGGKSRRG